MRLSFVRAVSSAFLLLTAVSAHAQRRVWASHAAMRSAMAVAASGDSVVWTATGGGLFRYRVASGQTTRVTVADGLAGSDARAVAVDARRGRVWIGYGSGAVDVYNPASGTVTALTDIVRADQFPSRDVRRIAVSGDSVFVATSFGVVVYDPERLEVRATYSRFGSLGSSLAVNDLLDAPLPGSGARALWVAVEGGVAVAPLDGRNLQDPASWTVETTGLPSTTVRALARFDGRLYAGTNAGLAVRTGADAWQNLYATGDAVYDLAAGSSLVGLRTFGAVVVETGGASSGPPVTGLENGRDVVWAGSRLFTASSTQGLVPLTLGSGTLAAGTPILPIGPYENVFADLRFASDGTLWAGGGGDVGGGFFRLSADGQTWTSFTSSTVPGFPPGGITVAPTADGGAWGGTIGKGAVRIEPSGAFTVYNRTNSSLGRSGATSDPDYIEVRGIAVEGSNVWATNRYGVSPLHVRVGSTWSAVPLASTGGYSTAYNGFVPIFVDGFGQKWVGLVSELNGREGRGLVVLDTRGTPADASDDRFRYFAAQGSGGSGLPGVLITSIDEDGRGRLWIGTERGPAYLANTSVTAQDNTAQFVWPVDTELQRYVLLGVRVNDVATDAAGNVWCATNEGAFRIDESGGSFSIAETFNASNSPLPSNTVISVAVSPVTGEVFFATDAGLVSWSGGPAAASPTVQPLVAYPNPFRAAEALAEHVTIRGLVAATAVRILAPDGRLVAQFDGRGGSVEWNTRDLAGQPVPSGVYLIVAVGSRGEGAAYGKIAVIR